MKPFLLLYIFSFILSQNTSRDISYVSSGGKLRYLQSIVDIRHYTLALDINIQDQFISGYALIDLKLLKETDTLLFDLVHLFTVNKISVNNKDLSFYQKNDLIYIVNNKSFKIGKHSIKIEYFGKPPVAVHPPWEGGFTWTQDKSGNPWIAINCQSEGAHLYFPCKDHPSDEPNEGVDLFITVPQGLIVAGPGILQSTKPVDNSKITFHWKTNYTISNYCILFNIAKYKIAKRSYTTINNNKVPIEFYFLAEDSVFAEHVLDIRARDTKILETYFGEYPWVKEKMGIAYVPNPGMEHQTMISYGDRFTYKKVGGQDYSDNLYHEFAHEWWANKVTNKDWAHMWIQEGIATYSEALCYRELGGETAYDNKMLEFRLSIKNKQAIVPAEEANSAEVYTGDIYVKGAFFMHTLRYVVGDSIFFPTIREFATDKKYTYDNFVTTDDIENLFSKRSKKDLKPLFDFYLRTTNKLELVLKQIKLNEYELVSKNTPMQLPLEIKTDQGMQTFILDNKTIKITSKSLPIIDLGGHYFKTVTIE